MQVRTLLGTVAALLCVVGLGCRDDQTREKTHVESGAVIEQTPDLVEDDTTPGVCELHHIPYAVEVIRVHYGYPARPDRDGLTEEERDWLHKEHLAWWNGFRYSHVANNAGGCVVREANFAKVSYCPECRKADEEWHSKHGRSPLAKTPN